MSAKPSEAVIILLAKEWSKYPVIVPVENFDKIFVIEDGIVSLNPDYEWHPYSGGACTYIQSYTVNHVRSCWETGPCQLDVRGIYTFDY